MIRLISGCITSCLRKARPRAAKSRLKGWDSGFQQAGLPLAASASCSAQRLTPLPRLLAHPRAAKKAGLKGGTVVAEKAASPQNSALRVRSALPLFPLKVVFITLRRCSIE